MCYKEIIFFILREDVSIHRTNLEYFGKSPKNSISLLLFIFWSPIYTYNYGVVFLCLWKYISVMEKLFFSFDRSNMQIFIVNITRVVWPHVTNILDLRYFCQHNPLFYLLIIEVGKEIFIFWVNIFVRHTFPMSKSNIKTKTVLTMTDMTELTELQAFTDKRMVKKFL